MKFGERVLFNELAFDVEPGSMVGLVGPSGSGKTTLLFAMAGMLRLNTGTVRFVLDGAHVSARKDLIAWIPQGNNMLGSRTLIDNVAIGSLAQGHSELQATSVAAEMLDRVGLGGRGHTRAALLSGGEVQRLALARALASGRRTIFADEPTGNLDRANTKLTIELMRASRELDRSVVIATHDPLVAAECTMLIDVGAAAP
jgi:putative ABC transport system ATP-binding protein